MNTGTVKWFDEKKGYGFIIPDDGGKDLFVHHSEIQAQNQTSLQQGRKVEYEIGKGEKDRPWATKVRPC